MCAHTALVNAFLRVGEDLMLFSQDSVPVFSKTRLADEFLIHFPLPFSGGRWCFVFCVFSSCVHRLRHVEESYVAPLYLSSSCISSLHVLHGVRSLPFTNH